MKRRYFFKTIIGAATALGVAPGLFIPRLEKPVWKPTFREIIAFNREWTNATHQVGILNTSGLCEVFPRMGGGFDPSRFKRFVTDATLPVRGNLDAFGKFVPVAPLITLRVKGEFKPQAYYF